MFKGSTLPIVIISIFAILLLIEFKTHFVESFAGSYLNWKNTNREAYGTYWERESLTREAVRQVDENTAVSNRLRRQVELVNSWTELLSIVPEGVGVPITPAKFVELYRTIPQAFRSHLMQQHELVDLHWNSGWRRCTIWQKGQSATVYLIDERNRIIRDVSINRAFISAITKYGLKTQGRLEGNPLFSESIYPAEKFFNSFFDLLPEERFDFLPDSDILLSLVKPLTRVGLRQTEEIDGYGLVGFESIGNDGYFVSQYPVPAGPLGLVLAKMTWQNPVLVDSTATDSMKTEVPESLEEILELIEDAE